MLRPIRSSFIPLEELSPFLYSDPYGNIRGYSDAFVSEQGEKVGGWIFITGVADAKNEERCFSGTIEDWLERQLGWKYACEFKRGPNEPEDYYK